MTVAVAPYPVQTDFYFSPLKVYEYMAAGLPVVVSHVGQLKFLIKDETNGLLVPPGDSFALATALDRLRRNPLLATRLGQAARKAMMQNHTWDSVTERILHLAGFEPASQWVGAIPISKSNGMKLTSDLTP